MSTRFVNTEPVPERVGWRYQGTLKDEAGVPIPSTSFAALTIKIYALNPTLSDIQTSVSVLNVGRGTLDPNGLLTVTFLPDDSAMVDAALPEERHLALIEGDYSTPTRKFAHEIEWLVINLAKRT
jgi:hypothetical protein